MVILPHLLTSLPVQLRVFLALRRVASGHCQVHREMVWSYLGPRPVTTLDSLLHQYASYEVPVCIKLRYIQYYFEELYSI